MIEHFKYQIDNADVFTKQRADEWINARRNILSAEDIKIYADFINSKVGQKVYYFMAKIQDPNSGSSMNFDIHRIFEDEIDSLSESFELIETANEKSKMPKFKIKK